jgi:hypothetical protein
LNSDTLITFTNILGDITKGFGNIIEKAGGLGNILMTVGLIFNRSVVGFIETGIRSTINNFKILTGVANLEAEKIRADFEKVT